MTETRQQLLAEPEIWLGIHNGCPDCPGGVCHVIECRSCEHVFERHMTLMRQLEVTCQVTNGHVCPAGYVQS